MKDLLNKMLPAITAVIAVIGFLVILNSCNSKINRNGRNLKAVIQDPFLKENEKTVYCYKIHSTHLEDCMTEDGKLVDFIILGKTTVYVTELPEEQQ